MQKLQKYSPQKLQKDQSIREKKKQQNIKVDGRKKTTDQSCQKELILGIHQMLKKELVKNILSFRQIKLMYTNIF